MRYSKRWLPIILGSGLGALLLAGFLSIMPALAQGPGGMMGGYGYNGSTSGGFGPGWMMGNFPNNDGSFGFGPGGMMGFMGGGTMFNPNNPFYITPQPLTLDETTASLDAYLTNLNNSNLSYNDVMIFDNHAYAQIIEKDSGIGVMEVLVDPTTNAVYPEMGPNMMWNQKYGMMSGFGGYGMGMMMGGFGATGTSAEMTVTPDQAVKAAQTYLDTYFSETGLTADEHADPFYGYYTLHVKRDGQTVGMLSVNAFTGQVFPHTWHGELLEMSGE
jgi:hypothetical protein